LTFWPNALAAERDQRRFDHEMEMARDQRRQQRLAETYIVLLEQAERMGQWAAFVRPLMERAEGPRPALPDLAEQARVEALVRAYGSPEVKALVDEWRQTIREIIGADATIRTAEDMVERYRKTNIDEGAASDNACQRT
jgi:hypothetical protein